MFLAVGEDEIKAALAETLAAGFFIEPTAAVAVAGFARYTQRDETIVLPLTGHGLKAPDKLGR